MAKRSIDFKYFLSSSMSFLFFLSFFLSFFLPSFAIYICLPVTPIFSLLSIPFIANKLYIFHLFFRYISLAFWETLCSFVHLLHICLISLYEFLCLLSFSQDIVSTSDDWLLKHWWLSYFSTGLVFGRS